MIRSRAKQHQIENLIDRLDAADAALCNAAQTNVLTGRADRRLLDILYVVRMFKDDVDRAIDMKEPKL